MTATAQPPANASRPSRSPATDAHGDDTHTSDAHGGDGHGGGRARHVRVAVIGTGFGGIGTAIRLKEAGIHDFVLLERAGAVGGTWRDNTYPGCACDVPSHLYSFSFAPNPDWPRSFSPQEAIRRYLEEVTDRYGVRSHVRFHTEMLESVWSEAERHWKIHTSTGDLTADVIVSAGGPLSEPRIPDLPGLADFPGAVFHSARWDHDHDLTGERVAVIGTGASAIQFVPRIQPRVGRLSLFQRTPPWVLPRADRPLTGVERATFNRSPLAQRLARSGVYLLREAAVPGFVLTPAVLRAAEVAARAHLRRGVRDPELRRRLTPNYRLGCKRVLLSNDYYPSLDQPNVDVIGSGLSRVEGDTVVGGDGSRREVDAIIFGTGFRVTDMPIADRYVGRDGVRLSDAWSDHMSALRSTTVHGYPNLFLLVGPNSGLGHSSIVFIIESQLNYVMDALTTMDRHRLATVEPRADAQARWNDTLRRRMRRTVWATGGCSSWYQDANGRVSAQWPSSTWRFRLATRRFDVGEYHLTAAATGRGDRSDHVTAAPRSG